MRTPDWDQVREFVHHDRWVPVPARSTDHDHFEKTLDDGEILITRVSRGSNTISPGRFKAILADQLRVGEAAFWDVLRTKMQALRPGPIPEPPPVSLPIWLAHALEREVGLTTEQMAHLDEESAHRVLEEARGARRD